MSVVQFTEVNNTNPRAVDNIDSVQLQFNDPNCAGTALLMIASGSPSTSACAVPSSVSIKVSETVSYIPAKDSSGGNSTVSIAKQEQDATTISNYQTMETWANWSIQLTAPLYLVIWSIAVFNKFIRAR